METVRAINSMAAAEASGQDGSRTPGAVALRRRDDKIHVPAAKAMSLLHSNELAPSDDRATQIRLASAIDRQIAGNSAQTMPESDVTRNIMLDVLMQEAAARRIVAEGGKDPLGHLASPEANREALQPMGLLQRNGVNPGRAFNSASMDDLSSIAAGKYDRIENEHTKFAVATILRLDERQMSTKTMDVPAQPVGRAQRGLLSKPLAPPSDLTRGPRDRALLGFGQKVGAER
ncbi:hypothetical protein [Erythrobacter aureus]|uniref:Uncharacterized protein n=1 Tax=Erythrobacter aureus TaxID=2182384 RepID=A0A345YJJ1_9SPHN|nr:hypothetical protein [Erythrobacter aureus]AXK44093.1 hypothetical protein DVR09_16705 [Erythrobacter aureus]